MDNTQDSFEKKLTALQDIVAQLETGEPELEKGVELFKQGVTLARECRTELEQAKKEVRVLVDNMWKDFDDQEEDDGRDSRD
ncbi:exodeoxyribonuclease VII small subunit [Desulfoplanes formicivorans]|uniref:Exodeoxyribonuclease 7 small subunit n=1 Tax=Desulfoplanes formicivorans TaxID=1592317 RepID=A0A194AH47_9BACT|nr:exodeoxyribonuclease VII small subunit [Desulfoplanes formicivorans]GAU08089.1 exodeoxyribonuclease VII small subunit [Desulfoplanes formicivorans]